MAFYIDPKKVKQSQNPANFAVFRVGEKPNYPGIYKCLNCGEEDVINRECKKLPPCAACKEQSHKWEFLVRAQNADEKQ